VLDRLERGRARAVRVRRLTVDVRWNFEHAPAGG
jgi:hypothetical protein